MRFDNDGMSLWFRTPDAPGPDDTVPAGTETTITIAVQPGDRSNKVEVLYRVNKGLDERVSAAWLRNDMAANVQYFRARIPPRGAGDIVEYVPVCRRAGRMVPSESDINDATSSFLATETVAAEAPSEAPSLRARQVAAGAEHATPASPTAKLKVRSLGASGSGPAKTIFGASTKSLAEAISGIGTASVQGHTEPAAGNSDAKGPKDDILRDHRIRIDTLNAVLGTKAVQEAVETEFVAAKGDWIAARANLQQKLPEPAFQKVALAHSLADWSGDNIPVVKAVLDAQPNLTSLRDLALHFNVDKLTALVDAKAIPEATPGATAEEKQKNFAVGLRQKLFSAEPTAVLQRMVEDAEIPIADGALRSGVTKFLSNQPDFNIRTTSIYTALKHAEAFKDIADGHRDAVIDQLKTLQRVQAISPAPEAVPALMKANLTSAYRIAEIPESTFLRAQGSALGEETARRVYANAINAQIRNEQALITMRQTMRGTGLAIIDGARKREERIEALQKVADEKAVPLNLETLFGSMDYCECDECLSVYSPASYFVETLQFLRNNNLDPKNPNTGQKGIAGTPLEKLFRRRPDLGCLELTCENTFTVLPYIDLVNEVMESFVVHVGDYEKDTHDPKQVTLETFNVEGETSSELLAEPQHTNYDAYCILKSAVYPFTLPYHQPIDATRIFLDYLKTSRWELLDIYRAAKADCPNTTLSVDEAKELQALHTSIQDRAVDAEFLGLTQEEYIILTKEAFWPKRYFEITQQTTYADDEYRTKIGVRQVCEYYGYAPDACADMLSLDENEKAGQKGLTFVKKQFLRRTGIQYADLVELLKTQFINPNFPQGKAQAILERIRFSYRFLQTLVDASSTDPKVRFAKLIEFLDKYQPLVPAIEAAAHPDPCKQRIVDACAERDDFRNWVYCHFERIGKLIVLESGGKLLLPIEGWLRRTGSYAYDHGRYAYLKNDGTIVDKQSVVIANVTMTGEVYQPDGKPLKVEPNDALKIEDDNSNVLGYIVNSSVLEYAANDNGNAVLVGPDGRRLYGVPTQARDTCDLDKVRLTHLDGTPLTVPEYDWMHRFIRLWRKLGWTIDETDKALRGLAPTSGTSLVPDACTYVDFASFSSASDEVGENCDGGSGQTGELTCPDILQAEWEITPAFLHQLVAVRKLLDRTGLPLPNLLAFWADVSTAGEKSLYAKLFLTHNLVAIDSIFQADANGNYLTQHPPAKITEHIPVLMAALKLKADDIAAIMRFGPVPDELTLSNISLLYRYSVLAKILHVRVPLLEDVVALFGDPFKSAEDTLALLEAWGKMEDAGFTLQQLDYLILDRNDSLRPLRPSQRTILQLTKALYDGLIAIDHDHKDIAKEEATTDLVRSKAGLVFEQADVEKIAGLLEGTTVHATKAPADLHIDIPETEPFKFLKAKLKYTDQKDANPRKPSLQVTGLLTEEEKTQAKGLSTDPDWSKAIDCAGREALQFFDDALFGIFPDSDANGKLLKGDVIHPQDPLNQTNTAPDKRFYFLAKFLPFLRKRLERRLIVDAMSGAARLPGDVTDLLLSEILVVGDDHKHALKALENIKYKPQGGATGWKGYLIPSADATYTFVAEGNTQPAPLLIGGQSVSFPESGDPPDECSDDPRQWPSEVISLKSGTLYRLEVADRTAEQLKKLKWKTATSPAAPIPSSALLPDYASDGTSEAFKKLSKAALLVNGFALSVDEVNYWQNHGADFSAPDATSAKQPFDFNKITLGHWCRLQAYTELRNNLPRTDTRLIDLFKWASEPGDATKLIEKIASATTWKKEIIDKLIASNHFDLSRADAFRNEVNLIKLRNATIVADKIGVDIDKLFDWAKPGSKFWPCHQIAEDIRKAIRARFDADVWEEVVRPLSDLLREHQKQALISYLLVQPALMDWGVVDADSLFEFFLIDVQMDACMQTSRIKQAISSVQLFIQRCLLGLEEKKVNGIEVGVPNEALDRDRWEWMQRYRVWEANRKVFLYPENWILAELRDDKSPLFKELESELLQKDINTQTVQDALKNYLIKVEEVANLKVVALHAEQVFDQNGWPVTADGKPIYTKLHVFARTRNAPYFFYYRCFQIDAKNWYAWEKVQVDIPSYDEEIDGKIIDNGTFLIPVAFDNRLLIFFPQFMKKTIPNPGITNTKIRDCGDKTPAQSKPKEFWELKMAWSEYRNGKWTQKQQSAAGIYESPIPSDLRHLRNFKFIPRVITSGESKVIIDCYPTLDPLGTEPVLGSFHFDGSQIRGATSVLKSDPTNEFTEFHYVSNAPGIKSIHSLQATSTTGPLSLLGQEPLFTDYYDSGTTIKFDAMEVPYAPLGGTAELEFRHPFVHDMLGQMATGDFEDLFRSCRDYF